MHQDGSADAMQGHICFNIPSSFKKIRNTLPGIFVGPMMRIQELASDEEQYILDGAFGEDDDYDDDNDNDDDDCDNDDDDANEGVRQM